MRPKQPHKPKPVTADWMLKAALYYLQRYAASAAHVRTILLNKAERRAGDPGEDADTRAIRRADAAALVDQTIAKLEDLQLLDDEAFARAKLRTLRRRGASASAARAKLLGKGVTAEGVADALQADETSEEDAALAFVRRHRLGAHSRREGGDGERHRKELARMIRAGFARRIAETALSQPPNDLPSPEAS